MVYEVDLRSRKDGESFECIYSGDYEKAYEIAENWNKENIVNFDMNRDLEDYIDDNDGFFAYVYHCVTPHGVGKF